MTSLRGFANRMITMTKRPINRTRVYVLLGCSPLSYYWRGISAIMAALPPNTGAARWLAVCCFERTTWPCRVLMSSRAERREGWQRQEPAGRHGRSARSAGLCQNAVNGEEAARTELDAAGRAR